MNNEELTLRFEELKRVLEGKVDDSEIMAELKRYILEFHIAPDAAKRGILRKYGVSEPTPFRSTAVKKISELTGTEQSVDLLVRIVFVEDREITVRGVPKTITSGIIGDETGTASCIPYHELFHDRMHSSRSVPGFREHHGSVRTDRSYLLRDRAR